MSKCAQQTASLISIASDFGIELSAVVHSDGTAALGIACRRGRGGNTRHAKVQYLWIQDAVENQELEIGKVGTLEIPADMLTKFLANDALSKHAQMLSLSFKLLRSSADKAARLWPASSFRKESYKYQISSSQERQSAQQQHRDGGDDHARQTLIVQRWSVCTQNPVCTSKQKPP